MNANVFVTMDYENISDWTLSENKPNSNPIKPNFRKAKMNVNLTLTKDYRKKDDFLVRINKPNFRNGQNERKVTYNKGLQKKRCFRSPKNKPNSKPIQTQTKPILKAIIVNFCAAGYYETTTRSMEYKMNHRIVFGATGLEVSPICFGTWQLSPRFWGEQSKTDVLAAMNTAFDAGINFFDTADAYGDGYAETVLGEFLTDKSRQTVVICTKVFNHFNPDGSRYPDLSPVHIRQRCDLQLQRMGVETIDLYLLHMFDPLTPLADVAETMDSLKKQGKIRSYGLSNHTLEQLRAQRHFGAYDVVQPRYSLIDTEIESDLLGYCEAEKIGVMVYSPMHKGLLTGKYTGSETFGDFRKYLPDFQGERFRAIAAAVQSLGPLAKKYHLSTYQLVLAATLMHPGIDVAIVGIKNPPQITEAIEAMSKTISREDYFTVRKALAVNGVSKIQDATGQRK